MVEIRRTSKPAHRLGTANFVCVDPNDRANCSARLSDPELVDGCGYCVGVPCRHPISQEADRG